MMKNATVKFNRERLSYAFRFNRPDCTIKVTNVYVHSPYEHSLNKQSIAWALNLKPFLGLILDNGTDKFERQLDISALSGVFDGYPFNSGTFNNYTNVSGDKTIFFTHGEMELIFDSKYGIPDISVELSLSPEVELLEEIV
jgi:hypothetical protein